MIKRNRRISDQKMSRLAPIKEENKVQMSKASKKKQVRINDGKGNRTKEIPPKKKRGLLFPGIINEKTGIFEKSNLELDLENYYNNIACAPIDLREKVKNDCHQFLEIFMPIIKRNSFHLRFSDPIIPDFDGTDVHGDLDIEIYLTIRPCKHKLINTESGYKIMKIINFLTDDEEDNDEGLVSSDIFSKYLSKEGTNVSPIETCKTVHKILTSAIEKINEMKIKNEESENDGQKIDRNEKENKTDVSKIEGNITDDNKDEKMTNDENENENFTDNANETKKSWINENEIDITLEAFSCTKELGPRIYMKFNHLRMEVIPSLVTSDGYGGEILLVTKPFVNDEYAKSHIRWKISSLISERNLLLNMKFCDRGSREKVIAVLEKMITRDPSLDGLTKQMIRSAMLTLFDQHLDATPRWQRGSIDECMYQLIQELAECFQMNNLPDFFLKERNLLKGLTKGQITRLKCRFVQFTISKDAFLRSLRL